MINQENVETKKIIADDFDFGITAGNMIYVEIDTLRFIQEEDQPYIVVEYNDDGIYEYVDEIEDVHAHNLAELELQAKKWVLNNVEIA